MDRHERGAAGWRDELRSWGVRPPAPLIGDWSARSGYIAGQQRAHDRTVTAVFVANDQTALGLILALAEGGRSVPSDISVIGFDDTAELAYFAAPLTTVHQDFDEIGRQRVHLLLSMIADGPSHELVSVPPMLVPRESTVTPRRTRHRSIRQR